MVTGEKEGRMEGETYVHDFGGGGGGGALLRPHAIFAIFLVRFVY